MMYSLTLELNQICNLKCRYCYLGEKNGAKMELTTAEKAINLAFSNTRIHKDRKLWIDFIGGEPLLSFSVIKNLVDYIEKKNESYQYNLLYSTTTNATVLSEEKIEYIILKNFNLKISLDGRKNVNDRNRIAISGESVHDEIIKRLGLLQKYERATGKLVQVTNVITKNNYLDYYDTLVYLTDVLGFKIIDSAIDTTVPWSSEELLQFEEILQEAFQYFFERAALNRGFHWELANRMLRCQEKKKRFYTCGGGIISMYVRTDGSMFACPGNLCSETSIGHVDSGYDTDKIRFLKSLEGIDNQRCRACELYEACTVNSCVMQNKQVTGNINEPAPVLCNMQKLLYRMYLKNEGIFSKLQM